MSSLYRMRTMSLNQLAPITTLVMLPILCHGVIMRWIIATASGGKGAMLHLPCTCDYSLRVCPGRDWDTSYFRHDTTLTARRVSADEQHRSLAIYSWRSWFYDLQWKVPLYRIEIFVVV